MNNLILGINTATQTSEIFLYDINIGKIIASYVFEGKQNESEILLPKILAMFNTRNRNLADLHSVVVVNGPGSFVSLRVGVITANTILNNLKGLNAYVLTTFDLLKHSFSNYKKVHENENTEIIIYAGGNQVFRQKNPFQNTEIETVEFDASYYKNKDMNLICDLPEKLKLKIGDIDDSVKIIERKPFDEVFIHLIKNGLLDSYRFEEKTILPNYIKEPSITIKT